MVKRVPRELGRSWQFFEDYRLRSNRYSKLPDDPSALRLGLTGDESQTIRGIAQRRKRSETTVRKSQHLIVPLKQGNHSEGPCGGKGVPFHEPLERNMPGTPRPDSVSTKRQRIAELARNCPDMAVTNLAHHIDIAWLHKAYELTRKDGAVGVGGRTAAEYKGV
jgi:hypothetical protein